MSATVTVVDPRTNRVLELNVRRKRGRTTIAELPAHLHVENASTRRLEHLRDFAQAAYESFGEEGFVDGVPVVAARVGEKTRKDEPRRRLDREQRQAYLRSLIPPETLELLEDVPKGQHIEFREPVSSLFTPVRRIRIRELGRLIPPLP
jgi:hypothetical protein